MRLIPRSGGSTLDEPGQTGQVADRVQAEVAARVPGAAALGLVLPPGVDVGRARFTRRASCCLLVEVPGQAMCTSCPRRPPAERQALLERL